MVQEMTTWVVFDGDLYLGVNISRAEGCVFFYSIWDGSGKNVLMSGWMNWEWYMHVVRYS